MASHYLQAKIPTIIHVVEILKHFQHVGGRGGAEPNQLPFLTRCFDV